MPRVPETTSPAQGPGLLPSEPARTPSWWKPARRAGPGTDDRTGSDALGLSIVLVTALALCWMLVPNLTAPFGDSHDGRNAGVWASASRAVREDGIVPSRLGGVHEDGSVYAHHPPLIIAEAATSEAMLGEHPWSTRLPVLLSTLVALAFTYLCGQELGLRPLTAALGAALGFLCPMVFAYGVMLDTPMTSLAFGSIVLWVWCRVRAGRAVRPWVLAGATALACLAGWEAMFLAWLAALALLVPGFGPPQKRPARVLLLGCAVGTLATVAWVWWASGAVGVLWQQLVFRSSGDLGATRSGAARAQLEWLTQLLGPALLGIVSSVAAALLDRARRPAFILLLVATCLYPAILYNAAYIHDYWNYWLILPASLGVAWAGDYLLDAAEHRGRDLRRTAIALTIGALAVVTLQVSRPTSAQMTLEAGYLPALLLDSAEPPNGPIGYIGMTFDPDSWMSYSTRRPVEHLTTIAELTAFAGKHPDATVLLDSRCVEGAPPLCSPAWDAVAANDADDQVEAWQLTSAADLAASLPSDRTR